MKVYEMSELFALMMLAWPNAPMFQPKQPKQMEATVRLWTVCLPDMEFLTGQAAVIQLCRTCKFPPSIAEMGRTEEEIRKGIEDEIHNAVLSLRNGGRYFSNTRPDRITKAVSRIGGEERLWIPINEREARFSIEEFRDAYLQVCQEEISQTVRALYPVENGTKRLK